MGAQFHAIAGRRDPFGGRLVLAAAPRVSSDFLPSARVSHHIYAAWAWAAGGLVWMLALARHLLTQQEEAPGG